MYANVMEPLLSLLKYENGLGLDEQVIVIQTLPVVRRYEVNVDRMKIGHVAHLNHNLVTAVKN
jgi:hypothetical protein